MVLIFGCSSKCHVWKIFLKEDNTFSAAQMTLQGAIRYYPAR